LKARVGASVASLWLLYAKLVLLLAGDPVLGGEVFGRQAHVMIAAL